LTISTTRTHVFNVAQLSRLGYRMAGLLSVYQEMTAQQASAAVDWLQLIVHSTECDGMFARDVEFETITLVASQNEYSLSASTLDCTGTAMWIPSGQTTVELPVSPISRERRQSLGVRTEGGPPTYYYIHRTADIAEAWIWPEPGTNEAGGTIRLQSHRLRADMTPTTVTPDFEGYWSNCLVTKLGMHLAESNALDLMKVQDLERKADRALAKCRGKSNQSGMQQFVLRHGRMR
jgi:hypothetical protein